MLYVFKCELCGGSTSFANGATSYLHELDGETLEVCRRCAVGAVGTDFETWNIETGGGEFTSFGRVGEWYEERGQWIHGHLLDECNDDVAAIVKILGIEVSK